MTATPASSDAGRILFAIPKKGRLYEHVLGLLKGADVQFTRWERGVIVYVCTYLPATHLTDSLLPPFKEESFGYCPVNQSAAYPRFPACCGYCSVCWRG